MRKTNKFLEIINNINQLGISQKCCRFYELFSHTTHWIQWFGTCDVTGCLTGCIPWPCTKTLLKEFEL